MALKSFIKKHLFALGILVLASPAIALEIVIEKRTDRTIYTCQQTDGDIWIEAGISQVSERDYMLTIVENNTDEGSQNLILRKKVTYGIDSQYTRKGTDFTELVLNIFFPYEKGEVVFKRTENAEAEVHKNLDCFSNSTISWDQPIVKEPRLSVGN